MKQWEASYTVELSLLLPVVFLTMLLPIYTGYQLYEEGKKTSVCSWDESFCAEDKIRDIKLAGEVWEELK